MNDSPIQLLTRPVSDKSVIEAHFLDAIVQDGVFPAGAFRTALPKLWRTETMGAEVFPDPERPVVTLARFTPGTPEAVGANLNAKVVVYCAFLPKVINGADWLRLWAPSQGLVFDALNELPTDYGLLGDAVARHAETGRLHRMLTIKDGDLLFLIDGSVDPQGRPDLPIMQEIGLMSAMRFALLDPSGLRYAEAMSEHEMSSAKGAASFLIPQSWQEIPSAEAPPGGALSHFVNVLGDSAVGTLVAALGKLGTEVKPLEEVFLGKLQAQGHQLGAAEPLLKGQKGNIAFEVVQFPSLIDGAENRVLSLRANGTGQPFSAVLVTPAASSALEIWATNRRVFEILLETFEAGPA